MSMLCSDGQGIGSEGLIARPDGPGDASELVGQSDGGFVVTAASLEAEGPASEGVGVCTSFSGEQDGSSAVSEKSAQVSVAALGDGAQVTGGAGGARRAPRPCH